MRISDWSSDVCSSDLKAIPAVDFDAVHAEHNDPEELWQKLILPNDQIFMVLSGHQHGQSRRIDKNAAGHTVYQILADYQDRGQALAMLAPDATPAALGAGWLGLMRFDLSDAVPTIAVSPYSTHSQSSSDRIPTSKSE